MRIGIAALHHETNSFSNIPMDWAYLRRTRFEKETYRNVYTPDGIIPAVSLPKAKSWALKLRRRLRHTCALPVISPMKPWKSTETAL